MSRWSDFWKRVGIGKADSGVPTTAQVDVNPTAADVPARWSTTMFGPGAPMPAAMTGLRGDLAEIEPRSFQYVPNVNSTISPRAAYGLMTFGELKYYYDTVPEVSMCRRLLIEELKNFTPQIVDSHGTVVQKARVIQKLNKSTGKLTRVFSGSNEMELDGLGWMTTAPDRFSAWPVWLSRFLANVIQYDAGAFYRVQQGKRTVAMRVIDGSTLFCLVDERGEQPLPPAPAFAQIIFGQPRNWFRADQLWYRPRQLRADAPYGITGVEDSLRAVQLLDQMWQYQAAWYTEGSLPEAYASAPQNWTPEQALAWEQAFNSRMAGNNREKRRLRVLPYGFTIASTKTAEWNDKEHNAAAHSVELAHGIHPSEIGKAPGEGLGGKGFQEQGESTQYRISIGPIREYLEAGFNDILRENGETELTWELALPDETFSTDKEDEKWLNRWKANAVKRNEYREAVGIERDNDAGDVYYSESTAQAAMGDEAAPTINSAPVPAAQKMLVMEHGQLALLKFAAGSAMLALMVDDENANTLMRLVPKSTEGEIPALHVTLAYMPNGVGGNPDQLARALTDCAASLPPVTGVISGLGRFTNIDDPDYDCLYASFDAPVLPSVRQKLVECLTQNGTVVDGTHGFTPHITLDYIPKNAKTPTIDLPPLTLTFRSATLVQADSHVDFPFNANQYPLKMIGEIDSSNHVAAFTLKKHCGVCDEDDEYYKADVAPIPAINGRVLMLPPYEGFAIRLGKWAAQGDEAEALTKAVGGALYPREEAVYLVDRALGFNLVPVAYTAVLEGERGAVIHTTDGASQSAMSDFGVRWMMKAAALDFVTGQLARNAQLADDLPAHPDDPTRPLLTSNGAAFPVEATPPDSAYVEFARGWALAADVVSDLKRLDGDVVWDDVTRLCGEAASNLARGRARQLAEAGVIA